MLEYANHDLYNSFDPSNTSVVTFVVAGNTTAGVYGDDCAEEGCSGPRLVADSIDFNEFFWSNAEGWNRTKNGAQFFDWANEPDYEAGVPKEMSDVLIINSWTVILDVVTPILNSLEIRGTLTVHNGGEIKVVLNSFFIDIRGGSLLLGTKTAPYTGPGVTISMHGDTYVHGVVCFGKEPMFSSHFEEIQQRQYMVSCGKRMDVNGDFVVNGRERVSQSVLGVDGKIGDDVVYFAEGKEPWLEVSGAERTHKK